MGAGPRRLGWVSFGPVWGNVKEGGYLGRREGWMLRPLYLAARRRRGGTKRPKETAIIKLIGWPLGEGIWGS